MPDPSLCLYTTVPLRQIPSQMHFFTGRAIMVGMNISDQGASRARHHVIPRTLVFLTSRLPQSGEAVVLLLRGAPTKRLWANLYNGLGGHVEAGEDVLAAALREVHEETNLAPAQLHLRGVVHIDTRDPATATHAQPPGILIFVLRGECEYALPASTPEGTAEWIPPEKAPALPLVDDLYELLPLALADGDFFYGVYTPQADGTLVRHFTRTTS